MLGYLRILLLFLAVFCHARNAVTDSRPISCPASQQTPEESEPLPSEVPEIYDLDSELDLDELGLLGPGQEALATSFFDSHSLFEPLLSPFGCSLVYVLQTLRI